jgi:hypothetical protein
MSRTGGVKAISFAPGSSLQSGGVVTVRGSFAQKGFGASFRPTLNSFVERKEYNNRNHENSQLGIARGTIESAYEKLIDAQLVVSSKATHVVERPTVAVLSETRSDAS